MQAKKYPKTFKAPNMEDLKKIKEGDFVKILAHDKNGDGGERFWVKVISNKNGIIKGQVDNVLIFTDSHGLQYEDVIGFEHRFVYDIFKN